MRKAKLIAEEATWQHLNYSRCGRTDKGVSAAGQVLLPLPHPNWLLLTCQSFLQKDVCWLRCTRLELCLALEVTCKHTSENEEWHA